ncbi:hypothetical protein [Limimaricola sp.]|uniref:hypothetical protein n=1 Tax=Limimaricola sp. TaxID=2211665 RepID=UPI0025C46D43|nr:hypothetical protein [Limimaricola sp.]
MLSALGWLALLICLTLWKLGGSFEYPLDDVYIHLAMADSLLRGEYGINPGENASAASSFLYPFLLAPFAVAPVERFAPLALNAAGLAWACWLWGRLVQRAGLARPAALLLAVAGPVLLNMPGVAFLGMEHSLHVAATLAVLEGLWVSLETGRANALLWVGVVMGPALRIEGLAVSGAACLALALARQWRLAMALGVAAFVPVVAFVGLLRAEGLSWLPGSVTVKMEEMDGTGGVGHLAFNLAHLSGPPLLGLAIVLLIGALLGKQVLDDRARLVAVVCALVGLAHLLVGRVGWAFRYENYVLVLMAAAALPLIAGFGRNLVTAVALSVLLLAWPAWIYRGNLWRYGPDSALALHLQQGQMARFAQAFWRAPVAVNDIGRVAWRNPDYVLDLWGLASPQAYALRLASRGEVGWADGLLQAHNVELAMVYPSLLGQAAGAGWVPLGDLVLDVPKGYLGYDRVRFFANGSGAAARARDALAAFLPGLPHGASFLPAGAK